LHLGLVWREASDASAVAVLHLALFRRGESDASMTISTNGKPVTESLYGVNESANNAEKREPTAPNSGITRFERHVDS
jgi:hypothetical protein